MATSRGSIENRNSVNDAINVNNIPQGQIRSDERIVWQFCLIRNAILWRINLRNRFLPNSNYREYHAVAIKLKTH